MKITVEKKEKVEVEVTFPCYTKSGFHYFKTTEQGTTQILLGYNNLNFGITRYDFIMDHVLLDSSSNEEEFNNALQQVKDKINGIGTIG